jgi:hypothetical protein
VASDKLRVTRGAEGLVAYESSKGAYRSFCGRCGSQLFMRYDAEPEWAYVAMGSLTTAPERGPSKHYSYEERVEWFAFRDELPKVKGKTGEEVE